MLVNSRNYMRRKQQKKIVIGISSCLLGERVRYDGNHKHDRFITEVLSNYFNFMAFCPEVAIGLGVPRPTIRLERLNNKNRAILQTGHKSDITDDLHEYGCHIAKTQTTISGYILKSKSPSCGMERVKVHDENNVPSTTTSGIYANALMSTQPLLPIEEEGRLNDPDLRDNFIGKQWNELI